MLRNGIENSFSLPNAKPVFSVPLFHVIVTVLLNFEDDRLTLDAAILNAADRGPPRVYRQFNYDAVTHNPLGRTVEVGVSWQP